jgi:hypothetical protein
VQIVAEEVKGLFAEGPVCMSRVAPLLCSLHIRRCAAAGAADADRALHPVCYERCERALTDCGLPTANATRRCDALALSPASGLRRRSDPCTAGDRAADDEAAADSAPHTMHAAGRRVRAASRHAVRFCAFAVRWFVLGGCVLLVWLRTLTGDWVRSRPRASVWWRRASPAARS